MDAVSEFFSNVSLRNPTVLCVIVVVILVITVWWHISARSGAKSAPRSARSETSVSEMVPSFPPAPSPEQLQQADEPQQPQQTPASQQPVDVGNYPVKQLFENKWAFLIDVDKCQKEYNFDAQPMNYLEFTRYGPYGRVSAKIYSTESSGESELTYRVEDGNLILSSPEGVDMFSIRGNRTIRLLEVENRVTGGEIFECKMQRQL